LPFPSSPPDALFSSPLGAAAEKGRGKMKRRVFLFFFLFFFLVRWPFFCPASVSRFFFLLLHLFFPSSFFPPEGHSTCRTRPGLGLCDSLPPFFPHGLQQISRRAETVFFFLFFPFPFLLSSPPFTARVRIWGGGGVAVCSLLHLDLCLLLPFFFFLVFRGLIEEKLHVWGFFFSLLRYLSSTFFPFTFGNQSQRCRYPVNFFPFYFPFPCLPPLLPLLELLAEIIDFTPLFLPLLRMVFPFSFSSLTHSGGRIAGV